MKLSLFTYILPLAIAPLVSGGRFASALVSAGGQAQSSQTKVATSLTGGAVKSRQPFGRKGKMDPTSQHQSHHAATATNQPRYAAFIPMETISVESVATTVDVSQVNFWGKIRAALRSNNDGLPLKERLAKHGLAAFLTYIMLGNIANISFMSFAWYGFSIQTGMSPFFPGQWKPFLAVYAGCVAIDSFIKPIRVAVSIAAAPAANRAMSWLQTKLRGSRTATVGVVLAGIIASSLGLIAGGFALASSLAGVPIFAP